MSRLRAYHFAVAHAVAGGRDCEGRRGERFPGWGFMRFWESSNSSGNSGPFHYHTAGRKGHGADGSDLFAGRIVVEPERIYSTVLGASPAEIAGMTRIARWRLAQHKANR